MVSKNKILVVNVAALSYDLVAAAPDLSSTLAFQKTETIFPALTCSVQASFKTAGLSREHGMISNGVYFRDLKRPLFWEQAATLVHGQRGWRTGREQGKKVGILFWQQSLGEEADLILSPDPLIRVFVFHGPSR